MPTLTLPRILAMIAAVVCLVVAWPRPADPAVLPACLTPNVMLPASCGNDWQVVDVGNGNAYVRVDGLLMQAYRCDDGLVITNDDPEC